MIHADELYMSTPLQFLGLAAAGAAGTLARYGLTALVDAKYSCASENRLYGTLLVNALGCLLFGLALAYFTARCMHDQPMRLILLTGFMGAFTTFSTFAYLSGDLIAKQQWWPAVGYILAHNVLGITLFIAGVAVGNKLSAWCFG